MAPSIDPNTQNMSTQDHIGQLKNVAMGTKEMDDLSLFDSTSAADLPNGASIQNHTSMLDPTVAVPPQSKVKAIPISTFTSHTTIPGGPHSKAEAKVDQYADAPSAYQFPRISRPVELLRTTYDTVVIGSGYGGGVGASRMARGGQSVCVLERGKEKWPGEYPSKLGDAIKELHISGYAAPWSTVGKLVEGGNPTGLYHLIVGQGQNVFCGNGLGGTSLLNANIFLEADDKTLAMSSWPEQIRKPGALKKYYNRAASVLEPEAYPTDFPDLPKLSTLEKQANALGLSDKFYRPPQTTRFVDGPNSTGVEMRASSLTGQDTTGLNDGSKSSTLVNYLSDAWNWGAEMFVPRKAESIKSLTIRSFCECEVRFIKKHPTEKGYMVFFAWHGAKRGAFTAHFYEDLMWVHAKKCVLLGAGAIGTTEILLRSQKHGLPVSSRVGTGMSGNGDILAFGYNQNEPCNAMGREFPSPEHPIGPTITGVIDCRDQLNPLDGFVIEEGAVPAAVAPMLQAMLELTPGKERPQNLSFIESIKHILARQGSRVLGPYFPKGSIEKTQVFLIMSHDSNQAILTLPDDKPELRFLGVGRSDRVQELNNILAQATNAMGGTFVNNPFFATLGQQEISVHPIGGAIMSSNGTADEGVTNHIGQVFTGNKREVHPGLVVLDASVVPDALGVNPFATITALAERSVEAVAKEMGISIDYKTSNGRINLFGEPAHPVKQVSDLTVIEHTLKEELSAGSPEFGFTEVMSGYLHVGDEIEDYTTAYSTARGLCEAARFFLSVKSWDLDAMVGSGAHKAMLTGSFACALPGSPFMINQGDFYLFNQDPKTPETKNLTYDFDMTATDGRKVHFHGYKILNNGVTLNPFKFWQATTTLYVSLTDPDEGTLLARGMVYIQPLEFVSECLSMQNPAPSLLGKAKSAMKFFGYFAQQSLGFFLSPFAPLQWPNPTYSGYITNTQIAKSFKVSAPDGVISIVNMWEPTGKFNGNTVLFIPGAAVDHQIYALPTIEVNAIDYFRAGGYRIYTVTHRIGKNMENEKGPTIYDARLDVLAAMKFIRQEHGDKKIYVVAHCMGSVAFASGLLDGTIPASWVAGITASQVFMNPRWYIINLRKTYAWPPLDLVYRRLIGMWYSCISTRDDSYIQQFIDQALRFYPVGSSSELCKSVVCHRGSFVFGRLWNHENLNEATHSQLQRFFGGVNMNWLHHAMAFGQRGHVMTNFPLATNLVTPGNINRLKGIPILLFSGADNQVFTPEATEITYDILRRQLGDEKDMYERVVFGGYGHLDGWMGTNAHADVYPVVKRHVDRVMLGKKDGATGID